MIIKSPNKVTGNISSYPGPYIQELEAKGYLTRIKRGRYRIPDRLFRNWLCNRDSASKMEM